MNNLRRFLPALGMLIVFSLMYFGIYYLVSNEEENYPPYLIRQDREVYRTDKFEKDSLGCLHFIDLKYNSFSGKTKEHSVTLCGEFSIEKIK